MAKQAAAVFGLAFLHFCLGDAPHSPKEADRGLFESARLSLEHLSPQVSSKPVAFPKGKRSRVCIRWRVPSVVKNLFSLRL
jgi:hypothetical protein